MCSMPKKDGLKKDGLYMEMGPSPPFQLSISLTIFFRNSYYLQLIFHYNSILRIISLQYFSHATTAQLLFHA